MSSILRVMLEAVFRQRAIFLAVLVGALALAGTASVVLQPIWRAQAVVELPKGYGQAASTELLNHRDLDRAVVARLGAQALHKGLDAPAAATTRHTPRDRARPGGARLGAQAIYKGLDAEAAAGAFARDFAVFERDGDLYQLTYDGHDPVLALKTIETALQVFGERHAQSLAEAAGSAFDQQTQAIQARLDDARQRLATYQRNAKPPVGDDERRQLIGQRTDLDNQMKKLVAGETDLTTQIQTLKAQMEQTPPTVTPNAPADMAARQKMIDDARARLLDLQLKEQELTSKYKDTSQFVVTVRAEIARVQQFLEQMAPPAKQSGVNDAYVEMSRNLVKAQTQLAGMEARRRPLQQQIGDIDQKLDNIAAAQQELSSLKGAVADGEAALARIAAERQKAVDAATKGKALTFVKRPTVSSTPVQPDPALYFGVAIPLGLLVGLGLAVLAQVLSGTFATPADIERRLGLPVLAALPVTGKTGG